MKLSEAIRVAKKIRPWINRMPELVTALDTLVKFGEQQPGDPDLTPGARRTSTSEPSTFDRVLGQIKSEFGKAWDEVSEAFVGDLPCEQDAAPAEDPDKVKAREDVLRVLERTAFVEGWTKSYVAHVGQPGDETIGDAEAAAQARYPDPRPVPPKPGDEVRDHEAAIKLPYGTLIKGPSGVRGLVTSWTTTGMTRSKGSKHVDWASDRVLAHGERWPATIVDVNVP